MYRVIVCRGKGDLFGDHRRVLPAIKKFRFLGGDQFAAHAKKRDQIFLPGLMDDKPVEIIQRQTALASKFVDDEVLEFIQRHRLIGTKTHHLLGETRRRFRRDIDIVLLHFGVEKHALFRPTIGGLFLLLRCGPLAVMKPEEQHALALGRRVLFGSDRFAIDHAQVGAGASLDRRRRSAVFGATAKDTP